MHMIERMKELVTHQFARNVVVMQAGTIAGTLVQALVGVFVARLLQPESFGQYSLAFSVASIATILLGAGVQDAVIPQISRAWVTGDAGPLRQALGFFVRFVLGAGVITVIVITILPFITAQLYQNQSIGSYAGVIVLASLVSITFFTLTQLTLQVAGRIYALSVITLSDVVTRYGIVTILIVGGLGIWGAVGGHLVGALVMFGVSLAAYVRLARQHLILPGIRELIRLGRMTPWQPLLRPTLWVMADRNLAMLYGALPIAMVGLYATNTEVAYFKLAFGYILLALSALGPISTLLNVHFPTVQVQDVSRLRRSFLRVTLYATGLSVIITGIVVVISPFVFRFLYGTAYLSSIPYVVGFGLFGTLFGLGVGLGPMWRAVDKVHISIVINLLVLGAGIPLGILLIARWHIWGAVAMVTLWYTVSHLISFLYLLRVLEIRNRNVEVRPG